MKKKKRNKIILIAIVSTLVILVGVVLILVVFNKKEDNNNNNEVINEVKKVDEISKYNYYLEEDASSYYKELYEELKSALNKEEVDMEEYASIITKLFVTDVFTLDNKITSSDVGGLQFVYPSYVDEFIKINQNTLYSSVISNIYGDRVQELPIVNSVKIDSIKKDTYNYNSNNYDSYIVNVSIGYEKDLDYPSKYQVTLIKEDNYLYVVSGK